MQQLSLADLTNRLGQSPAQWTFLGQCYDAGEGNERVCMVTQKPTRIGFTLKLKSGAKGRMTVSPEAIAQFERWNPDLYVKLKAGLMWLELRSVALAADVQAAKDRQRIIASEKKYSTVRNEARDRIRDYRKQNRKAKLPEYLEAMQFLLQSPGHYFKTDESRALSIEQKTTEIERALIVARQLDIPEPVEPETTENLLDKLDDIPEIEF